MGTLCREKKKDIKKVTGACNSRLVMPEERFSGYEYNKNIMWVKVHCLSPFSTSLESKCIMQNV
jgi:hypothetical protein